MKLIFDTETTGLCKDYKDYKRDDTPRLVTLSFILVTDNLEIVDTYNTVVKPEGFIIPKAASDVHGVTHEMAVETGVPISEALDRFAKALELCDTLVAHNINYDILVMRGEFYRAKRVAKKVDKFFCTKEASTNLCKIPSKYGKFKWPTLTEACEILMGYKFDAHNSEDDTRACLELYKYLTLNKTI